MNPWKLSIIFYFCLEYLLETNSARVSQIEITNITCTTFDTSFATISKCELTKNKGFSFYIKLNQRVENFTASVVLSNLVDKNYQAPRFDELDLCDFFANKIHSFWPNLLQTALKDSNFNHPCPYEDALSVDNFSFQGEQFKFLPLPRGKYKVDYVLKVLKVPKIKLVWLCDKV